MSFDVDKLFGLLPSLYRVRDQDAAAFLPGDDPQGPLEALLAVIADQLAVLEQNFSQSYDDQFIETCAEWVVPYIGDLVGTRGVNVFPGANFSVRGQVANTIQYRRRKGTAAVLEQLAHDVTGWGSNVVEYFQLLATTQYMNHIRQNNLSFTSLKQWELLQYMNTPFDTSAKTVEVRRIANQRGKYNIPNIGIFLWRLADYSVSNAPAYKVDDLRYKFNALGFDTPLYNQPVPETQITHLATPINVPMPIPRLVMSNYFDNYYGIGLGNSILIYINGAPLLQPESAGTGNPPQSPPDDTPLIRVCNLSDMTDGLGNVTGWYNMPKDAISIDPVLGRIAFPSSGPVPQNVHVNYSYGFSADIGGGDYLRADTFTTDFAVDQPTIKVPFDKHTIQEALLELQTTGGAIEIEDNEYYIETPNVNLAAGVTVEIRSQEGKRPTLVLADDLMIFGDEESSILFNGLMISGGSLHLPATNESGDPNKIGSLTLTHCTLLPVASPAIANVPAQPLQPRLIVETAGVTVTINECITGAILANEDAIFAINNSIIDASDPTLVAFAAPDGQSAGAALSITASTVIGKVNTMVMKLASNTIFYSVLQVNDTWNASVTATRLQQGCVRFCYLPPGTHLPRPYVCVPSATDDPNSVKPVFTSLQYGDAGYCQLAGQCSVEITTGADSGAEIGVFYSLNQPQREANLRIRLDEYLRFGLEAGIFYGS